MSQDITKGAIFKYLQSWDSFDKKSIEEKGQAYRVTLSAGNKSVVITMPYEVGEFFLDFLINNEPCYSDWYEIMEESLPEFMQYTRQVAEHFLFNEVRVKTSGWWVFKIQELQYYNDGAWCGVFEEKT